ncbi:MAG: right-handed parallel beta-helix repeat-containing protein [Candidatus Delongbacteria bacterium]|nr:right-handed parallel beta-helix repeat-containing protein [Candidatus Delongbacteria bacterium]MBN2835161.1 right-handed parallel beta-helix repeat-containing protein [Candidatus Delongbacteria bacterium]
MIKIIFMIIVALMMINCSEDSKEEKSVIYGNVTEYQTGRPVSGVKITALELTETATFTSVDGNYEIETGDGEFTLDFEKNDYLKGSSIISVSDDTKLDMILIPDSLFIVTPVLPANNSTIDSVVVNFKWNSLPDATRYKFILDTTNVFNDENLIEIETDSTNITPDIILDNQTFYYWTVKAKTIDSDFSDEFITFKFKVVLNRPYSPIPQNNSIYSYSKPLLSWHNPFEVKNCRLEVATDENFDNLFFVSDTIHKNNCKVTTLVSDSTKLYWRVKARNIDNVYSDWSNTWNFDMIIKSPENPDPFNGKIIYYQKPLLNWPDYDYAQKYIFEFDSSSSFNSPLYIYDSTLTVSQYKININLPNNKTYYWRVKILDENGLYSNWSEIFSFTIKELLPLAGFITSDSTLVMAGNAYHLTSNLYITREGSLTINEGVEIYCEDNTAIVCDGGLKINGSNLNPVILSGMPQSNIIWRGLVFNESSDGALFSSSGNYLNGNKIQNVHMIRAGKSASIELNNSSVYLKNISITESNGYGIISEGCDFSADSLNISNCGGIGIKITEADKVFMDDLYVTNCSSDGIYIENGSVKIKNSSIEYCKSGLIGLRLESFSSDYLNVKNNSGRSCSGIDLSSNVIVVKNSEIENNSSTEVGAFRVTPFNSAKNLKIENCTIANNLNGDEVVNIVWNGENSSVSIANNLIYGNSSNENCIYFRGIDRNSYFRYNSVYDNITNSENGKVLVNYPSFDFNDFYSLPVIQFNNFVNPDFSFEVANYNDKNSSDLNCRYNYWGVVEFIGSRIYDGNDNDNLGKVNFSSFKTEWIE